MFTLITVFHLLLALMLIVFVLLQDPKGGGAFGMGGGNSQSVFGASGAGNFLSSATKYIAISFTATCIVLSYLTLQKESSVTDIEAELPAAAAGAFSTDEAPKTEDK